MLAASSFEGDTPPLNYCSFTSALIQELNKADTVKCLLTVAQLWYKFMEEITNGNLQHVPIHAETQQGSHPRTSILLAPLRSAGELNLAVVPLKSDNITPLGIRLW